MARLRKDFLLPGTWTLADGRTVRYSRADAAEQVQRTNELVAAGVPIPLYREHQGTPGQFITPDYLSMSVADKARNTLGWVEGAELDDAGIACAILQVPDDDDARNLAAIRFASPELAYDAPDGTGRVWRGRSMTHLAATPRPVQLGQRPFQRLSLNETDRRPVRLSLEGYMADDTPTPDDADTPDVPDVKPDADTPQDLPGKSDDFVALVQALRDAGLNIPDEVQDLQHLVIAVKACQPAKPEETPDPAGAGKPADQAGKPVEGASQQAAPVLMSLDAAQSPMGTKLVASLTKTIEADIADIKTVPRPIKVDWLQRLKTTERLSLDVNADPVKTDLLVEIAFAKKLPPLSIHVQAGGKGAVRMSADAGDVVEVPNPVEDAEKAHRERIEKDTDERAKRLSVNPPKPRK